MWGYPVPVLGAISPFLEPFRGYLSPKVDKVYRNLTLRYPHEGPCVDKDAGAQLWYFGVRGSGCRRQVLVRRVEGFGSAVVPWDQQRVPADLLMI